MSEAPVETTVAALHRSAVAELRAYDKQPALRDTMLAFLAGQPDGCLRANVPGHITGSMVLLSPDLTETALTLHPRVGLWLQLGGHCEPTDADLPAVALREAREESGIDDVSLLPGIVHLDTHPITCSLGQPTFHLDLRYAAIAANRDLVRSTESVQLRWWPVDALPELTDASTTAAVGAAVASAHAHRYHHSAYSDSPI